MRRGYTVLFLALLGCDPTSGLADTADAALPTVKRYFDGPGSRVADGPWNRVVVDLDADTLYHIGGRRLDDEQPTFHLFGSDAQAGCDVSPNAGTWLMSKPSDAPFRLLPYLEQIDENGRGSLRFTTLDCKVQDLVVEDAGRPYPQIFEDGYLVPVGQGYAFVNPWTGDTRTIAETLQASLVWKEGVLLWADQQLKSFSSQFEAGETTGAGVVSVVDLDDAFLIEDDTGLHLVEFNQESLALTSSDVLPGACRLQLSSAVASDDEGSWVMMQMPCGNPRPTMVHLDELGQVVGEPRELPFPADSAYSRAMLPVPTPDSERPLSVLYLENVDAGGFGELWTWQDGSDAPVQLAEHSELDSIMLEHPTFGWDGIAQTNYQELGGYLTHDWLHFRWNGETELIAERVLRNGSSGELLINFDGVSGDLPSFGVDYGVVIVAQGLPPSGGDATSYVGTRRHARVDHFDGNGGRVVLIEDQNDPESWQELGTQALPESLRFAWFMPALLFLENWEPERKVGTLVAYNYELDARTTIAEGVSSFDMTSYPWDGLIYAVPYGGHQGLWFTKAK